VPRISETLTLAGLGNPETHKQAEVLVSTWAVLEGKITIGAGGVKANARAGEAGARLFLSLRRSPGGSAFERSPDFFAGDAAAVTTQ
jgi:hypothetical protein